MCILRNIQIEQLYHFPQSKSIHAHDPLLSGPAQTQGSCAGEGGMDSADLREHKGIFMIKLCSLSVQPASLAPQRGRECDSS